MFRVQPVVAQQPVQTRVTQADVMTNAPQDQSAASKPRRTTKVRPNDPCPCGSGKKYKHCHGSVRNRTASPVA
jgi:uncharacterized protein YecA (UPF0149 family)